MLSALVVQPMPAGIAMLVGSWWRKGVTKTGHQEVVVIFSADETVDSEMMMSEFRRHLEGAPLESHAASVVKGAYCVVGNGLVLAGAAFFLFEVDEHGLLDPTFNLPLKYLVQQAGVGGNLGQGVIRMASRGRCPVPWHSINLWEPVDGDVLALLQSRVRRNKLGLKTIAADAEDFFQTSPDQLDEEAGTAFVLDDFELYDLDAAQSDDSSIQQQTQDLTDRLEDVFGQEGKLTVQELVRMNAQQINDMRHSHRQEIEAQQASYLGQIKACRDEIHDLKVALRQEQSRSRRLQEILRGEP